MQGEEEVSSGAFLLREVLRGVLLAEDLLDVGYFPLLGALFGLGTHEHN
jgi:hypothetical protein